MIEKNLKYLRKERKLSQAALGAAINESRTVIDSYESGRAKPKYEIAKKLADYLEISVDALFNVDFEATGLHIKTSKERSIRKPKIEEQSKVKAGMPVYEASPATLSNIESYRDEKQEDPDFWLSIPQYRKCNYACRAKGDSMHPVIRNHALVGGKEIQDLSVIIFGDIYIIHTKNGIETIKYIHPDPNNPENLLLVPYNGNAKTTPIHKSDIIRLYQAEFVINPL